MTFTKKHSFDHLRDYKLLRGSHEFPGEAGGACLNEVAIVAAGLDYCAVRSASDCPACFSLLISSYVIGLNDEMPDNARQDLKRFVLRLAGSADLPVVERRRAQHIVVETVRRVLPIALDVAGLSSEADRCRSVTPMDLHGATTTAEKAEAAARASGAAWKAAAWTVSGAAVKAARAAGKAGAESKAAAWTVVGEHAANAAAAAAMAAQYAISDTNKIWPVTLEILDRALAIGNQAPAINEDLVVRRLAERFAAVSTTECAS